MRLYIKSDFKKKITLYDKRVALENVVYGSNILLHTHTLVMHEMLQDDFTRVSLINGVFVTQDGIISPYDLNNPWNSINMKIYPLNLKTFITEWREQIYFDVYRNFSYRCFNS